MTSESTVKLCFLTVQIHKSYLELRCTHIYHEYPFLRFAQFPDKAISNYYTIVIPEFRQLFAYFFNLFPPTGDICHISYAYRVAPTQPWSSTQSDLRATLSANKSLTPYFTVNLSDQAAHRSRQWTSHISLRGYIIYTVDYVEQIINLWLLSARLILEKNVFCANNTQSMCGSRRTENFERHPSWHLLLP